MRSQRMILIQLPQTPVAHEVKRRVPDRDPEQLIPHEDRGNQRRAHTRGIGVRGRMGGHALVGGNRSAFQHLADVLGKSSNIR